MDASGPGASPLDRAEIVLNFVYLRPLAWQNQSASLSLTESFLIKVYDIMGREINVIRNGLMTPGKYNLTWNGTNSIGNPVSSGTYFIVIQADQKKEFKKLLFLK